MTDDRDGQSKPVIGLIGGVGAGKSTVANAFERLGCAVIDADREGHEVLRQPEIRDALAAMWGRKVLSDDGEVSRPAIAEIVFDDRAKLDALNALTHPRIARRIARRIEELQADSSVPAIVLDAAVVLEAGWDRQCTHLVFVAADSSLRRSRASTRRGWDEEVWRSREKSQIPLDRKAEKCSYQVDNSSSASHLDEQVRDVFHRIVSAAD